MDRHYDAGFGDGVDLSGASLGGPDLAASLARWAAEARVDEAARARSRQRWMEQAAAEDTTFASVLADLAERARPVLVQTATGRRHRGVVVAIGVDFVAVHTDTGADVLVALGAVTAVRSGPGSQPAHSGRAVTLSRHLADAIAAMAEDRPRVTVSTGGTAGSAGSGAGGEAVNGILRSVGRDVLTLRMDGDSRANVYVPLHAVADIAIAV